MMDKFVRIYSKDHEIIDELYRFAPPTYGWTLNDISTMDISFALNDPKCDPVTMQMGNHIELIDQSNKIVWGGVVMGQSFEDVAIRLNCMDYGILLKYCRMRAKQYPNMEYGALIQTMIEDCRAARAGNLGISIGEIATGALKTERKVDNSDFLWDKIKEYGDDANYDYGVDNNRAFYFCLRRGQDKPYYVLEYGGDADNIIVSPSLARDILDLANEVYAEVSIPGEDGAEDTILTATAGNDQSIQTYGLFEGVCSINTGVTLQSTVDTSAYGDVQRRSIPADTISLTIRDSALCPFDDIEVGDRVTLHIVPYFDYTASVRILAMTHDESAGTRSITVGSTIFKPQPPTKRFYKG